MLDVLLLVINKLQERLDDVINETNSVANIKKINLSDVRLPKLELVLLHEEMLKNGLGFMIFLTLT